MRILVLGGTVFLSRAVATAALDRGHEVVVAARGRTGDPPRGAQFVRLDRNAPSEGLTTLGAQRFDAVVDVARLPGHVAPVLDALADRVAHWTFVSTISVYPGDLPPGSTPDSARTLPPAAATSVDADVEHYGANKVACENLVRDRMGGNSFIVRPGLIAGPGDPSYRFGYWADRLAAGGEVLAPGAPEENVQWIDVRDQAQWIVHAAETGLSGTFDAVAPPALRADFLTEMAEALNTSPRFTWVPGDFLLQSQVRPWSGADALPLWVPIPELAGLMSLDVTRSLHAGLRIRPVADSALAWRDWARDRPRTPGQGLTREREAEVLAAWHASSSAS